MIFRLLPSSWHYFYFHFHSFHSCLFFSVLQSSNILKCCFNNFDNAKIYNNFRRIREVGKSNFSFVKRICLSVRPSVGLVTPNKTTGPLKKDLNKFIIFLYGATATSGPGPPHFRGFTITLRHTTIGRTPLDA